MTTATVTGYSVHHAMDYSSRHFEIGEFIETLEVGLHPNDRSLINIGYLKEHDGTDLVQCLRDGRRFVAENYLRYHERTCPMIELRIDTTESPTEPLTSEPPVIPELPEPPAEPVEPIAEPSEVEVSEPSELTEPTPEPQESSVIDPDVDDIDMPSIAQRVMAQLAAAEQAESGE